MKPYLWMRLVRDSDLQPTTRIVAVMVGLRADKGGACYPSYSQLSKDSGLHRRTVIRQIACLIEGHWLLSIPRSNGHGDQANTYQILDPRLWTTDPSDLWKTGEGVSQDHQVVTQGHPLGSDTGPPRRSIPKEELSNQPLPPVDNQALAALLGKMSNQHRIPQ